jgi:thiamine-phosphate pyrophosphorylase
VTDRRSLSAAEFADARETLLEKIAEAAAAGVDWIQIREKDLSGKECSQLTLDALRRFANSATQKASWKARRSRAKASAAQARILVNDRLDVALAIQAGGVHLGETSFSPQEARRLVKSLRREKNFVIGVSCHSLNAAKAAERGGADYIFFGPVFATPSKAAYGAPQGLERLAEVCRAVSIPVLAIGGITLENFSACFSAGASGIAAIRLFQDAKDVAVVVRALRKTSA